MSIHAPDYVRRIAPYQAGKPISELAREYGLNEAGIVKLASNENPLGMPESARAAMMAALDDLGALPRLQRIRAEGGDRASATRCRRDWITLGNGSNDILELAAHALLQPGQSGVYSQHSFAVYALATQEIGARAIVVPARDLGHDLDAMARRSPPIRGWCSWPTRTIRPAPSCRPSRSLERFLATVPRDVVVVLDEAYNEYLDPAELRFDSTRWLRASSEPDHLAHLLQGLRAGRSAGRLRARAGGD